MSEQHQSFPSGVGDRTIGHLAEASIASRDAIPTFAFHIHGWKQAIFQRYFPDRSFTFVPLYARQNEFQKKWAARILQADNPQIFVWSLQAPDGLRAFAEQHGIPVFFIEDGFIRSVRANASRTPPLSLALDAGTAYFDCRTPSDLERLLATYDFDGSPDLLRRASAGIRFLLETGVSKYNSGAKTDIESLYGPKTGKRVLVIGQVEDDASIQYGCLPPVTNNDLVRLAAQENPGAQIIYKPHPDILNRVRLAQSNPEDVRQLCDILTQPLGMAQAFETIDHVYTITSLAGFEALLRGIKVTAYGCPFYAGWGLTDDRQPNSRRGRPLSIEALFAGAYLLYPRYFDPDTGKEVSFEETVDGILRYFSEGDTLEEPQSSGPAWRAWGPYGILGWRHLLTPLVSPVIARIGHSRDVQNYRDDPILFFRELSNPKFRLVGRILYPFD
jgi:capsule polysaccharide export protein KpsC/LpsZ